MSKWDELEQTLLGSGPLDPYTKDNMARDMASELSGMVLYPQSLSRLWGRGAVMAANEGGKRRVVWLGAAGAEAPLPQRVALTELRRQALTLRVMDGSDAMIDLLRTEVPWLRPRPNPGGPSIGTGDVLGLATPGHVRGLAQCRYFPILGQRSMRQNQRTGRGFAAALRDVVWGVFREGHELGYGADADHISKPEEVEEAARAGYVRFTFSLAEGLPDVGNLDRKELARRYALLESRYSWAALWRKKYLGKVFQVPLGVRREGIAFDERTFMVTGLRIAEVVSQLLELSQVVRHTMHGQPFEIEVSMDEAMEPTSPHEHLLLALELGDLGIPLCALAPRLPEELIEGLPYEGHVSKVMRRLEVHAGISRLTSQHAISIHAGGGKWTLLGRLGEATEGAFHVKISAPALHEALRLVLHEDAALFCEIVDLAKATYQPQGYRNWDLDPSLLPSCSELVKEECERVYFESREGLLLMRSSLGALMQDKGLSRRLYEVLGHREERYLQQVASELARHLKLLEGGDTPEM